MLIKKENNEKYYKVVGDIFEHRNDNIDNYGIDTIGNYFHTFYEKYEYK